MMQDYNNDYLAHYGVVGMKWGVRRAAKKGNTYTYKSFGTGSYERRAKRAEKKGDVEKAKKYKRYHERSVELDRKMQKNALNSGTGKVVAKTLLTGPYLGGRTYEAIRAVTSKADSPTISRAAAWLGAYLTGPIGATPVRALYVRDQL